MPVPIKLITPQIWAAAKLAARTITVDDDFLERVERAEAVRFAKFQADYYTRFALLGWSMLAFCLCSAYVFDESTLALAWAVSFSFFAVQAIPALRWRKRLRVARVLEIMEV